MLQSRRLDKEMKKSGACREGRLFCDGREADGTAKEALAISLRVSDEAR
jgi:hypothetical protein